MVFQPGAPEPSELPVLLVEAPRGSGKSELLTTVLELWSDTAPTARIDLKGLDEAVRPYLIAASLADHLGRRTIPLAAFSRLSLGLASLEPALPSSHIGAAEEALARRLRNRDAAVSTAKEVARIADAAVGPVSQVAGAGLASAVGAIVSRALPSATWYARRNGAAYQWYRERVGTARPLAALVELNERHAARELAWVDEVLVDAFLADLRSEFHDWPARYRHDHRVLVLLDDVDWVRQAGAASRPLRFVELLLARRAENCARGLTGDPIVLVATSATRSAAVTGTEPAIRDFPFAREVRRTTADPASHPRPAYRPGSPARLHVVDASGSYKDAKAASGPVDRLRNAVAAGHRAARDNLPDPTDEQIRDGYVHLEAMLPCSSLDRLLADLVEPERGTIERDVVLWSARCPGDALAHTALQSLLSDANHEEQWKRRRDVEDFVTRRLWDPDNLAEMLPWFRTVFLSVLATRQGNDLTWDKAFTALVAQHEGGDRTRQEYYRLALEGQVTTAARWLGAALSAPGGERSWVATFEHIARAPRRRDFRAEVGYRIRHEEALGVATDLDRDERLITRALAARWLSNNAVGSPELLEYLDVADALSGLAGAPRRPAPMQDVLFTTAVGYRRAHDQQRYPYHPDAEVV